MKFYGTTTLGTPIPADDWRVRAIRILLWFLPRANPDYERLFPRVAKWFLEVDDSGKPCREIGLDRTGAPLFAMPDDRNFGYFADSDATFAQADLTPADQSDFERMWASVTPNTSLERTREG